MKRDWFALCLTTLLIVLIITLIRTVSNKVEEDFTELYFTNYKELPKLVNNSISFSYTIHNRENRAFIYTIRVSAELFNEDEVRIVTVKEENITLDDNELRNFVETIYINDWFKKIRLRIELVNKGQYIHFLAYYAKELANYENMGIGTLDCVNISNVNKDNKITVSARGSYAEGWPEMSLYYDGILINKTEVKSKDFMNYKFSLEIKNGMHFVDIVFDNDQVVSNETGVIIEDRNLFLDNVEIGGSEIEGLIADEGLSYRALDCKDIKESKDLYRNGALRFRIMAK